MDLVIRTFSCNVKDFKSYEKHTNKTEYYTIYSIIK